jgi:DNA (cytosine-5)-methyltransferase 1
MDFETETFLVQPAHTLRGEGFDASEDGTGRGTPLVPAIAFNWNAQPAQLPGPDRDTSINDGLTCSQQGAVATWQGGSAQDQIVNLADVSPTLAHSSCAHGGHNEPKVMTPAMQVRRLTPRECERLQGFPDDYTLIPWRKKPASECPDGPRYKALGNSWAVPNVRWIGARIQRQLEPA